MKMLIFGSEGMAGHMIANFFADKPDIELYTSSRRAGGDRHIQLDVRDRMKVEEVIGSLKPEVIVNCTGILNQMAEEHPEVAFEVNGMFPHQLAKLADRYGGRLIHISTDCVFSGDRGRYQEGDQPDGTTVYARSKMLGELIGSDHLTIRTSIIGPELKKDGIGLFHWFMQQTGTMNGFTKAMWNGVTTLELAKAIEAAIADGISGLYHLTAPEIVSKHELLMKIKSIFGKEDVEILPTDVPVIDRTLVNTRTDFVYEVPGYDVMLQEMKDWIDHHGK